jgi:exodeoxyribonuclease VII small subunit
VSASDGGELGYGEALAELEGILAELERESVDVDHLVERVQRAAVLIRLCRGRIATARMEIETVVADLERASGDDAEPVERPGSAPGPRPGAGR